MKVVKAVSEALKFFNRLSIDDLVDNFNPEQLSKIRTLILKEVKGKTKIDGKPVVSGKDIGKINKAIKKAESGDPSPVSRGAGKGSKVKATTKRNQKDWEKLFESDTFSGSNLETNILRGHDPDAKAAFKAWKAAKGKSSGTLTNVLERAGPKIEPTPTSTNVEVLKKPRRRIMRKKPRAKGGMVKRPQMVHGGSHKSKKHAYAAGGSVKELKLFK